MGNTLVGLLSRERIVGARGRLLHPVSVNQHRMLQRAHDFFTRLKVSGENMGYGKLLVDGAGGFAFSSGDVKISNFSLFINKDQKYILVGVNYDVVSFKIRGERADETIIKRWGKGMTDVSRLYKDNLIPTINSVHYDAIFLIELK